PATSLPPQADGTRLALVQVPAATPRQPISDYCPRPSMNVRPRLRACLLLLVTVSAAAGCRKPPPPTPPPPQVTVRPPVRRTVTDYREYSGRLDAVESVEIRARVRGFLQKIHFQEGT